MLQLLVALALQAASPPLPATAWNGFFTRFDADHNGKITKAEVNTVALQFDARATAKNPAEKGHFVTMLATMFEKMDKNGDGVVTREEYQSVSRG